MCALASRSRSADHQARLVYLDANAQMELSQALALPRVGAIGVMDKGSLDCSTTMKDLIAFGRDHLSPVKCSLLDQSAEGVYQPLKIA